MLLSIRLVLAYGFFAPAKNKLENISSIVSWFKNLGIPFPEINAYLATGTEVLAVIFLTFGIFTRYISIPLIGIMLVAIFTVHINNGFESAKNGFEIPLYYILLLFTLFFYGGGKFSVHRK